MAGKNYVGFTRLKRDKSNFIKTVEHRRDRRIAQQEIEDQLVDEDLRDDPHDRSVAKSHLSEKYEPLHEVYAYRLDD